MADIDVNYLSEAINDKMDRDAHNIQSPSAVVIAKQDPTSGNAYTWYRLYSDGWVEQGGYHSGTQDQQITLPVAMSDNRYAIALSAQSFGSNYNGCIINIRADTQTDTGFKIQTRDYNNGNYARDGYWQVSGKSKQN